MERNDEWRNYVDTGDGISESVNEPKDAKVSSSKWVCNNETNQIQVLQVILKKKSSRLVQGDIFITFYNKKVCKNTSSFYANDWNVRNS